MDENSAIVLFSGGQDSATCLAWALSRFERVETIGFDYGQRHHVELEVRQTFLSRLRAQFPQWGERLGGDETLDLRVLEAIGGTAMIEEVAIKLNEDGLPNTFVPGRNLLFVTLAACYAYRRDIKHLVTGVCETDYSGYPDCRDDTMKALQVALNLGMETRVVIDTPLMWRDKAATWAMAHSLGGNDFVDLIVEHTHTCYTGDRSTMQRWGAGCGECPACELRANGWQEYSRSMQS